MNEKGLVSRIEGGRVGRLNYFVHRNLFKDPTIGVKIFLPFHFRFTGTIVNFIDGDIANKMIQFLNKELDSYPFRNKYHLFPGPNSNTFIQWVINKFPESRFTLPWNVIGKGYK